MMTEAFTKWIYITLCPFCGVGITVEFIRLNEVALPADGQKVDCKCSVCLNKFRVVMTTKPVVDVEVDIVESK